MSWNRSLAATGSRHDKFTLERHENLDPVKDDVEL